MTTNTTKIAEAIGILSSVLSDEVAATKHFVEEDGAEDLDLDEFVTVDEYEELKEAATDAIPAILSTLDDMKANIGLVVDVSDDDWLGDADPRWEEYDNFEENEGEEASEDAEKTPTPEPTDAEKVEALTEENTTLKEEKDILTETLKTLHDNLEEAETALADLQDDVESR